MMVMRGLLNGGRSGNRYIWTAVARRQPEVMERNGMSSAVMQWRRMLSSGGGAEAQVKEKREEKQDVVMSSYWGISKPKITREDGTEWPWNCFMVSFHHTHFSISSFFFICIILKKKIAIIILEYYSKNNLQIYQDII